MLSDPGRINGRPKSSPHELRELYALIGRETSESLQETLDAYIEEVKLDPLTFDEDSVPKPIRFAAEDIENVRLKLKLRFDAKFDNHDFRVNPLRRSLLRRALQEGGFL